MVKPTIQLGNPLLTNPNKLINDFADAKIKQIIQDLKDTMYGRVIQHEFDHLNGITFIQKTDTNKLLDLEFYIKNIKTSPQQMNNSHITIKSLEYRD